MRRVLKIVMSIMLITFFMINCLGENKVLAGTIDEAMNSAEDFLEAGKSSNAKYTSIDTTALKAGSDEIYNLFLAVGTVIAVIVGLILGIQFITSAADEKAKIKETLVAYIIGCVVVFGAFIIWKAFVVIGNKL